MFVRIIGFLLESVFFVLIAASLLRAWMNWTGSNMRAQPGSFILAVTDWIVQPLRRLLPASLRNSRIDWASLIAALVLGLLYAVIWAVLFGLLLGGDAAALAPSGVLSVPLVALKTVLRVALQTLLIVLIGFAILSWVQRDSPAYVLLARLTEPLLAPLRRVVPVVGGVDLSALVLILIIQIGLMIVG